MYEYSITLQGTPYSITSTSLINPNRRAQQSSEKILSLIWRYDGANIVQKNNTLQRGESTVQKHHSPTSWLGTRERTGRLEPPESRKITPTCFGTREGSGRLEQSEFKRITLFFAELRNREERRMTGANRVRRITLSVEMRDRRGSWRNRASRVQKTNFTCFAELRDQRGKRTTGVSRVQKNSTISTHLTGLIRTLAFLQSR
jgi:hypothetical protein